MRRTVLGPLLLFALFGVYYTFPPQGGDQRPHISYIAEADRALSEGQFPLRVSPMVAGKERLPLFQFYGNFPYTLTSFLMRIPFTDVDPYEAWKLVVFLSVTCAGFYTYRVGLILTRQVWPSLLAGAVFVAAPYLSTDFRARFAFPEAVSMCLLPAVLYYALRTFVTRRWGPVIAGGVAWALLALSHNITYLYGSTLIALMFLSFASLDWRKYVRRMTRVGLSYALGVVLVLWFIVPQLKLLQYIPIAVANASGSPIWTKIWSPMYSVLSPVLTISPEAAATPAMGVQVGAPILVVVALSTVLVVRALLVSLRGRGRRRRGLSRPGARLVAALVAQWVLSFFILWSPVDFWAYVPKLFYNLQILYRMLMFIVLWGSVLTALALAAWWPRRVGGMPAAVAWPCLVLVAIAAMPFQGWKLLPLPSRAVRELVASPEIFAGVVYRPLPEKIAPFRLTVPPDATLMTRTETATRFQWGLKSRMRFDAPTRYVFQLPILFYPGGVMEVRDNGHKVRPHNMGHIDGYLAILCRPGAHALNVRFIGVKWANRISGVAWLAVTFVAVAALAIRVDRTLYAHYSRRLAARGRKDAARTGSRAQPAFPVWAAPAGAAVLIVPMASMAGYVKWRRAAVARAVGQLTVSSEAHYDVKAINAFDGDTTTVWAAATSHPGWLINVPPEPRLVSAVELEPREADRLAAWHQVEVVLYSGGDVVSEQKFSLPDAARERLQVLKLDKPAVADKIELRFAEPVLLMLSGGTIDPNSAYPGYREIRFR